MDFIPRILILVVITFSPWVATLNNEAINTQNYEERQSGQLCPPMAYKEKYEVVFIENGIQMYGCASLDHNREFSEVPVLQFWFEAPINSNLEPTFCKNINKTVPYIFECMSKTEPTNKEEIDKGLKYISLNQYPTQFIQVLPTYRCAAFVAEEHTDRGIIEIRMVFSNLRAKSYDKTQCEGLSYMLLNKDMIYDVEKLNKWPEGASYVFMRGNIPPKILPTTKKITTTTERPPFTFYDFLYALSHHRF